MKKWTLNEHLRDIYDWHHDQGDELLSYEATTRVWFTAYERWLNDRELLSIEDDYQWKTTSIPKDDPTRSPARQAHSRS